MSSKEKLYVASKMQSYDELDEDSLILIFPHIYFTIENIEEFIIEKIKNHSSLQISANLLQLLDKLALVNLKKIWNECYNDLCKRKTTQLNLRSRIFTYNDYEAHGSLESKVRLIVQQLQHVLYESHTEYCESYRCCSLLESPTLLNEFIAIISAILIGSFRTDLLPDVIIGLSIHCALNSRHLIERLILNFPEKWPAVYESVLEHISITKTNPEHNTRCLAALHHLSTFVPDTNSLLNKCVEVCQLPGLVMDLAIKQANTDGTFSILNFFKRVLLDEGQPTRNWLGEYLKSLWDINPTFAADVNDRLLAAASPISDDPSDALSEKNLIPAIEFLGTIAALCGYTGFVLSSKLRTFTLNLITRSTGRSEKGVNFICYCLAFTIGLRSCLFDNSGGVNEGASTETEDVLITWLQRLISRQDAFHTTAALHENSSYSEVLLLYALLFNNNQQIAIRDIIVATLHIDAPCLLRNISASRKLFTQKVFTSQSITEQAARVPVTVRLNAQITGNLPIHCVFQLLKTYAFNKNKVQIKGWIYRQICESIRPLHPLLLDLLETYATNVLAQGAGNRSSQGVGVQHIVSGDGGGAGCVPFTEAELLSQFSCPALGPDARMCAPGTVDFVTNLPGSSISVAEIDLTPQLLFLYYMLYIYDQELNLQFSENRSNQKTTAKESLSLFSEKLWDAIPIAYLLQYARANLSAYSQLYPRLLKLVTNYRPHLLVGESTIQDELLLDSVWQSASIFPTFNLFSDSSKNASVLWHFPLPSKLPTPSELLSILDRVLVPGATITSLRSAASECIVAVNTLTRFVGGEVGFARLLHVLPYAEAIGCRLPRVLLEIPALSGNRRFAAAVCFLWRTLHCIMPRRLEVLTVKALSAIEEVSSGLTHTDLLKDPVENIVMAVDRRVYRCPSVLTLLIRVLECNMIASRSFWQHRVANRFFVSSQEGRRVSTATAPSSPSVLLPITKETESRGGSTRPTLLPIPGGEPGGTVSTPSRASQPESPASDELCERLRMTLVASQDAAVVQLLFEFCLPTPEEKQLNSEVTELREVQNILSSFINSLFKGDPNLASIVFWQTYPRSINAMATRAIPSMQICTNTVTEVFVKSGSLEQVVFATDFVSHLALHSSYAPVLDLATYAVETMNVIFSQLASAEELASLLLACGASFCRLGCAFPSLSPRLANILLTAMSNLAEGVTLTGGPRLRDALVRRIKTLRADGPPAAWDTTFNDKMTILEVIEPDSENLPRLDNLTKSEKYFVACVQAMLCFNRLGRLTTAQRRIYFPPSVEELPSLLSLQSPGSLYSSCNLDK